MTEDEELHHQWLERLERYYDIDGNEITMREWGESYKHPERRIVKQDYIGPYFISTVLLGIDHGFDPTKPPILFETMIFKSGPNEPLGGELFCERYPNKEAALAGHDQAVERARHEEFRY